MAFGGYPDIHSSVNGHRGGRGGGQSHNFRSRGRGKEMLHYQRNTDRTLSDYFPYDKQHNENEFDSGTMIHGPAIVSSSGFHAHKEKRGKFRGRGRRPFQKSHVGYQVNSK